MSLMITAVFAVLAAYFAVAALAGWVVRDHTVPAIGNSAWHLLMSLAMVAMAWPALMPPTIVLVLVFTAAALWFAYRALFGAPCAHLDHGGGNAYHATMMAAMVVMSIAMAVWATPTGWAGGADVAASSMAAMPGMSMGGAAAGATPGSSGIVAAPVGSATVGALCWLVGIGFAVAGVLLAIRAVRRRIRRGWAVAESGAAVAMALGMAAAFVQLQ